MATVFIGRRCADHLQFTARQNRLQNISGIDRALCRTCADDGMDLIDKENDIAVFCDLVHDLFESLFKFSAVFCSCDHRADIQRHDRFFRQIIGLANPSTTAVFPTPGSPIKQGLFFVLRDKI